jgi:hypothetical protein
MRTGPLGYSLALEQTYTYCCTFKPEMIQRLYATAEKSRLRAQNEAAQAENARVPPAHRPPKSNYTNKKDITTFEDDRGTSRTYALRALACGGAWCALFWACGGVRRGVVSGAQSAREPVDVAHPEKHGLVSEG